MLRLLAIFAGLVLLALLVFVLQRGNVIAPISTPTDETIVRPEDRHGGPLSAVDVGARNAAATPAATDANYVSIVGEVMREEDGTPIEGAVAMFAYRYLSKGPQAELRHVPVDVDEHGHFEQLFSEPVQLVSCLIEPIEIESSELTFTLLKMRRADFLQVERPLDTRVAARGVRVSLQVSTGLEITGRVFDVQTNESQAGALVFAEVDFDLTLGTRTNSSGLFRMRGIDPVLAQPGRDYVAIKALAPDAFHSIDRLCVRALAASHRPGSTIIPLPLAASRPTRADIPVASGIRVAGTVLDFSGKPVPKARVDVIVPPDPESEDQHGAVRAQSTLTDAEGRFAFDSVELIEGCEVRAQHPWQAGPAPHLALGSVRQERPALVLTLPDTECYRIQVRDTDGSLLESGLLSVSIRDVWGERTIDGSWADLPFRMYAAIGARTGLTVSIRRIAEGKEVVRYARTTLEPLVQTAEPETVILDLEP